MPDKKLTDNEIIKALKSRMFKENKYMFSLIESTLNLINRLQAENDSLKNDELPKCKDALRRANEIGVELQAENELLNMTLNVTGQIKAEAYKEFAERVKLEFYYEFEELIPSIMADKIDNLLKELIGDDTIPNDVKCIDCEHLELSLPYGVCSKEYKMVNPNDSCGKGKLKEEGKDE